MDGDDIEVLEDELDEFVDDDLNEHMSDEEEDENGHDDADKVFDKHTGSVFCCDLTGNGEFAVSGGEDNRAFVWSTTTGDVLFECPDHNESVVCVCFNHDDTLLATGDIDGVINVWKLSSKTIMKSYSVTKDLLWLKWHPKTNVLLAGSEDGNVYMWHTATEECRVFASGGPAPSCCSILLDGLRLAVGYKDGSVYIWNLKTSNAAVHKITKEFAHKGEVTCIESYSDKYVLSGSVDGTAKLINSSTGKVLRNLNCTSSANDDSEQIGVEHIGFCQSLPIFATGSLDGNLIIWDLSTQTQRQNCDQQSAIIRLVWDHQSPLLYTGGEDGTVRLWDSRNGTCVSQWSGHENSILDMKLSKDSNTIITASDDKTCRVFHVNQPDR